jgi:amidophosphoribosyltransferase
MGEEMAPDYWDDDEEHVKDECGVFGIYAEGEDVARLSYFGLFALQHRGQESAGIAVTSNGEIFCHKRMGLVTQVFDETVLRELSGYAAIGHARYSTTGSSVVRNAQPIVARTPYGPVAVAHNGNLLNAFQLRENYELDGDTFESTNDSEVIAHSLSRHHNGDIIEAIRAMMNEVHGAYSLTLLTPDAVFGVRDPYGLRPLAIGQMPSGRYVLSSETCALNVIGANYVREVEPGEIVRLDAEGMRSFVGVPMERPSLCILEFIYLARPDSHMYGRSLHLARRRMGQELAREHPVDGGIVIPIPDTGIPAAIGYAEASRIPFGEGLIKSRYIHRTFIQPEQTMREAGVRMKFTPLKEELAGKKVIMVDDSIVRGTSTRKLVKLLFEAGAAEVHVRISSPPVKWPCFYGIDMDNQDQLIASRKKSVEAIREHIGATSLGYLSLKGLTRAIGVDKDHFCTACLTGEYPIDVPQDLKLTKLSMEAVGSR